ncbi:hypothetical protein KQX54_012460 [Cotesia glomerata]|uniref:Uncharacterized protein n=1 Tax=Cotesia glomerata TaxID=32391 RepID=A0AAV7I0K7_COTGL|nr:hypothetical protein KQX54_012460 [Cotesia glomerata]
MDPSLWSAYYYAKKDYRATLLAKASQYQKFITNQFDLARTPSEFWRAVNTARGHKMLHNPIPPDSCYMEKIETAHLYFYKRLMHIPSCTPNYALRLELNLSHNSLEICKAAYNWVIKILDMKQESLPKICLLRLIALNNVAPDKPNWIQYLKRILQSINEVNILDNLSSHHLKLNKERIIHIYRDSLRNSDLERYSHSTACQIILYKTPTDGLPNYLRSCPQYLVVPKIQLRLANNFNCNISIDKSLINLNPMQMYRYCHNLAAETVEHFLLDCPLFHIPRLTHLQPIEDLSPRMNLVLILDDQSVASLKALHLSLRESAKLIDDKTCDFCICWNLMLFERLTLLLSSLRLLHSFRRCLMVTVSSRLEQTSGSLLVIRWTCMRLVWPTCSLVMIV